MAQRAYHAAVVGGRLANEGTGHRGIEALLPVVEGGGGLLGQRGMTGGVLGRSSAGRYAPGSQVRQG